MAQSPGPARDVLRSSEPRPFPPPAFSGFGGTTQPLRHPAGAPVPRGHPVGYRWPRSLGFPCCVRFPCVHAAATTPAQRLGVFLLPHPAGTSLPRKGHRVGLRIVLFEACSAFTRVAACTLARSPIRDPLTRGFSHFVASMTAPVASGWSGCRVGLAPTGKRRLSTAHTRSGHQRGWTPAQPLSACSAAGHFNEARDRVSAATSADNCSSRDCRRAWANSQPWVG